MTFADMVSELKRMDNSLIEADSDWMVRIDPVATNGLDKASAADAFQIRSVSTRVASGESECRATLISLE